MVIRLKRIVMIIVIGLAVTQIKYVQYYLILSINQGLACIKCFISLSELIVLVHDSCTWLSKHGRRSLKILDINRGIVRVCIK